MGDPADFDLDQRELFDTLMLTAENNGDAYRCFDVSMAIATAWHFEYSQRTANLRHDYRTVMPALIVELTSKWSDTK